MSELQQEKKTLSFEEICPQWSRRIANYDELTNEEKTKIRNDLALPERCFLGEANGFNIDCFWWHCEDCSEFGDFIGHNALCGEFGMRPVNWNSFNSKKEAFVKHWNEVHVK
jgi:hypothetical protein